MTPEILLEIGWIINHEDLFQVTMWCLFLTSFFLMLRKSNVCKTYSMEDNFLRRKHIKLKGNHILVSLFWTKTLQLGERVLEMPLLRIPNSPICPVRAMACMLILVPGKGETPLFAYRSGKPITYPRYMKFFKNIITKIGLDCCNYSTHSFHWGAVSWKIKNEIPESLIQVMGDWKSDFLNVH